MEQFKKDFIDLCISTKALTFGDFITKSGRQTPYFFNTGLFKTGQQISLLAGFYAQTLQQAIGHEFTALYGPAYKGIPLATSVAMALYQNFKINVGYCFNRKEIKDHGEKGMIIGHTPQEGDRIVIIEDVTTAGTSIRESIPLLSYFGKIKIEGVIISVDRKEKGQGEKSALDEIHDEFGIKIYSIVTIDEIIEYLFNREIDGKIYINKDMKKNIDKYRSQYCA